MRGVGEAFYWKLKFKFLNLFGLDLFKRKSHSEDSSLKDVDNQEKLLKTLGIENEISLFKTSKIKVNNYLKCKSKLVFYCKTV